MSTISRQVTPPQDPHAGDELLTIAEVADVVRVPVATLRYWRHLGTGPHSFRVGRGYGYRHRFRGGYYPYYYSGYRGCYRWRRVLTPYGWHVRRINVCYRPYYHRYRLYGF